ncbi:UNVERIFIED_CONTAM: hypothetical protein FKN15_012692 [Acipenser sinensis]
MIVRFCPHCGTKIEAGFKFCPSCGVMLPQQDPEETVTDSISQMAVSHASPYSASCSTGQGSHIDLPPRSPLCTTPRKRVLFASIKEEDEKHVTESSVVSKSASAVDKWRKHHKMDFLGIPTCVGFGLHADTYRFLILPNMGVTLQSIMGENGASLSERAVFQVACRILDVLEYIHDNEYVHADIRAENVYVDPTDLKQASGLTCTVHLAGYCYAFRYSPSGNHVEYRELSRTPHEGAVEFLSIDSHKGAGPSRRSDLQSLGYCMLKWMCGSLPWSDQIDNPSTVMAEKERQVPQRSMYKTDVKGLLEQGFGKRKTSAALQVYLDQVMALGYNENPNYVELRNGIKDALQKLGASAQDPIDVTLI